MKVRLMYRDRDFDLDYLTKNPPCWRIGAEAAISDLELDILLNAMAGADEIIREAVKASFFPSLQDADEILYRQQALKDCLDNAEIVRRFYALAVEALAEYQKNWWSFSAKFLSSLFSNAVSSLKMFAGRLKKLRDFADKHKGTFRSEAFLSFFSLLRKELGDDYLNLMEEHLQELEFKDGILISARLGSGLQGVEYTLRRKKRAAFRRRWIFAPAYKIAPRDDHGAADLTRRKERAIGVCTNVLGQAAEHVLNFFMLLRHELAFYVGCLNLHEKLREIGVKTCFPTVYPAGRARREFRGLCDIALALHMSKPPLGNDLASEGQLITFVTGANQGGKSTFLRSIGQSQIMMQSGMFVAASQYATHIVSGVYVHFKREEDASLKSGKLDEELTRMSELANHIKSGSLLLSNESFSTTNEREGAEIARQIFCALAANGIEVMCVTHLYALAKTFYNQNLSYVLFLRAKRQADGSRSFRITPGEPLRTAFGEDLFIKIFGDDALADKRAL